VIFMRSHALTSTMVSVLGVAGALLSPSGPVAAHERPAAATQAPAPWPHLAMAGERVRRGGEAGVYLVDPDGYRRGVPSARIHTKLFTDDQVRSLSADAFDAIAQRPDLDRNAYLAQVAGVAGVYLMDGAGRWGIASRDTMAKYHFDWSKIVTVPQEVMDAIPELGTWR
jgi:hypothetical protein